MFWREKGGDASFDVINIVMTSSGKNHSMSAPKTCGLLLTPSSLPSRSEASVLSPILQLSPSQVSPSQDVHAALAAVERVHTFIFMRVHVVVALVLCCIAVTNPVAAFASAKSPPAFQASVLLSSSTRVSPLASACRHRSAKSLAGFCMAMASSDTIRKVSIVKFTMQDAQVATAPSRQQRIAIPETQQDWPSVMRCDTVRVRDRLVPARFSRLFTGVVGGQDCGGSRRYPQGAGVRRVDDRRSL